jgi:integrase
VTPRKRGAAAESFRLAKMQRHALATLPIVEVTSADIAEYRDDRLRSVSPDAVRKELCLIRQAFDLARKEWRLPVAINPADEVRRPAPGRARTRRISGRELGALAAALERTRNPVVRHVVAFALATGMRRGEILRVRWPDIDWDGRTLAISETKTGEPRTIPLTTSAIEVLAGLAREPRHGKLVFPVTANAFRLVWERVCARAGVLDLRFHDFRHEACRGSSRPGFLCRRWR